MAMFENVMNKVLVEPVVMTANETMATAGSIGKAIATIIAVVFWGAVIIGAWKLRHNFR